MLTKKLKKFLLTNIIEILLAVGDFAVLVGFCIFFAQTEPQTLKVSIGLAGLATLVLHIWTFVMFLATKSVSIAFDIIYFISCVLLALIEALMGIFYLEDPSLITFKVVTYVALVAVISLVMFCANIGLQNMCPMINKRRSEV